MFIIYLLEAWNMGCKVMPLFLNSNISIIEKVCVLNFFHSFQIIPMKLATSNPHEESMFITYFLWGLTQRFQSYVPFFNTLICAYRGVSIFFQSFQVIFFMFWLIVCDKGGIFITMNDSPLFSLFLTSKPIFQNSNLQYTTSFWAVWKWIMSLLKQLKSRSFWGPFGTLTKALPWTHRGPCWPPAPLPGFKVRATFSPVWCEWVVHVDKSETPILGSSPHPVAESLLKHWFLSKDNYIIVDEKV